MPRTASPNGLSIGQLESLLYNRRNELQKLEKQKSRLMRELNNVDDRIRQLGGRVGGRIDAGRRARNEQSLISIIENVLKNAGKPMPVADIVAAVQRRGYRSTSANFRAIVNQALIKDKRFAQAGRGIYQLKK